MQNGRFFDQLIPKFDVDGGVIHGLVHYGRRDEPCYCPACHSRRARNDVRGIVTRRSITTFSVVTDQQATEDGSNAIEDGSEEASG
jgi:hypothetical protein